MREAHEFSPGEWALLVPVRQWLRQLRNDALLAHYRRQTTPELGAFLRRNADLAGKRVAIVVAFEQPWSLRWQLRMAARNLQGVQILVVDNSREASMRRQIREVCEQHRTPYLGLPRYRTRHANRSHGMAMTWVWHNVVRPLGPKSFGFLDHDMIPVAPTRPAEHLREQPIYGLLRPGRLQYWYLWAGYCFYEFEHTALQRLNFLYDFSRELDTGGRNWTPLYGALPRQGLRFASQEFVPLQPPSWPRACQVEVLDDAWIHVGGVSYKVNFESRRVFFDALFTALDAGASLGQLRGGEDNPAMNPAFAEARHRG